MLVSVSKRRKINYTYSPTVLMEKITSFLEEEDLFACRQLRLVARNEECHLVLHSGRPRLLPDSARYISPSGGSVNYSIPKNELSFSFIDLAQAALAIKWQWLRLHPWEITVFTVVFNEPIAARDVVRLYEILKAILPALSRVKHFIVINGETSSFFNIALSTRAKSSLQHAQANLHSIGSIFQRVAKLSSPSDGGYCAGMICTFPPEPFSPLTSVVMPVCDAKAVKWHHDIVPSATGPLDRRLRLLVMLKEEDKSCDLASKVACLRHASYVRFNGTDEKHSSLPDVLDFSKDGNLIAIELSAPVAAKSIVLPTNTTSLQVLVLNFPEIRGAPLLQRGGPVFPFLQHLHMPAPSGLTLDSACFPAVKKLVLNPSTKTSSVDLSSLTVQGLDLWRVDYRGKLIMPKAIPERLAVCKLVLKNHIEGEMLPLVKELHVDVRSAHQVKKVFEMVRGNRAVPRGRGKATYPLRVLTLWCHGEPFSIKLQGLPQLQHLTLHGLSATVDGDNFEDLESLSIEGGIITFKGEFPALRVLKLRRLTLSDDSEIIAPLLQECCLDEAKGADTFLVRDETFPLLQSASWLNCPWNRKILPLKYLIGRDVPRDMPDIGPSIVLRMDAVVTDNLAVTGSMLQSLGWTILDVCPKKNTLDWDRRPCD